MTDLRYSWKKILDAAAVVNEKLLRERVSSPSTRRADCDGARVEEGGNVAHLAAAARVGPQHGGWAPPPRHEKSSACPLSGSRCNSPPGPPLAVGSCRFPCNSSLSGMLLSCMPTRSA